MFTLVITFLALSISSHPFSVRLLSYPTQEACEKVKEDVTRDMLDAYPTPDFVLSCRYTARVVA